MTQPLLAFDGPSPGRGGEAKPVHPVAVEKARLNAAALRVLAYLKQHGSATNVELCQPSVGGMRAVGARLPELRKDGWKITKEHVSGGIWRFTLHGYR